MSKNKSRPIPKPAATVSGSNRVGEAEKHNSGFSIPYPLLFLALSVLVVYFPSFSLGFTELDDTIFIKEFRSYNEDVHNLIVAFTRGLFDAVKDPYYRPLFSDAMILSYQASGVNPAGYHFFNIVLHLASVLLFYRLAIRLGIAHLQGFLLALIFAVHPVLSQAVAWIPGRNDTLLAVFVLSFIINTISFSDTQKARPLVLSMLFLLLAYFTKETAVFAAPAALLLLWAYKGVKLNSRPMLVQYGVWAGCFVIWYIARSMATTQSSGIGSAQSFADLIRRLPVIVQYIGKIVLPFSQSVFPTQQDTVIYFGIIAFAFLVLTTLLNRRKVVDLNPEVESGTRSWAKIMGAVGFFLLFLMPALLVPAELNQQTFEHRLYLPSIGILLLLPNTIIFANRLREKQIAVAVIAACVLLGALNMRHQRNFEDPLTFWKQAAETSPNSAYANMMLAARLDKSERTRSEELFRKAYALNPKEKYLNFYMGEMLQKKDSVLASEPYLLAEKKISNYAMCDFYLARVAMEKQDLPGAISYLQAYLKKDAYNPMANNNLLLLLVQMHRMEEAKAQALSMKQLGMNVPVEVTRQLGI